VRHLVWDAGGGFEPRTADRTAWFALAFGLVAALVVWATPLMSGSL
jgi:succinate dehydrogenase/fumarate reductase cytochrome b subunit